MNSRLFNLAIITAIANPLIIALTVLFISTLTDFQVRDYKQNQAQIHVDVD